MSRLGTITILASGLALTIANLHAESTVAGPKGGSYSPIVARNVFGLNPPSPSTDQQDSAPPPKITLTGITTILGPVEVLYKVAGSSRDDRQSRDKSYILTEGQEQDGVMVMTIDAKKATVTFNNHGVRQDLALNNEPSSGETSSAPQQITSPLISRTPKPGDYNYVDEKSVTAPLPPDENPASAIDAPSMSYGGGDTGGDVPPGHGGS